MVRKKINCPYCKAPVSLNGSMLHVKIKHPEKYKEFIENYQEIKKTAYIPDEVKAPAPDPLSARELQEKVENVEIEEKKKPVLQEVREMEKKAKKIKEEAKEEEVEKPESRGDAPIKKKSFLEEFDDWLFGKNSDSEE